MELNSVFGGDTLKAADLQGHEIPVIISDVTMKKFDNGNKLVLTFDGKKKALVCNKTNANRIAHYYGTNTDLWVGKEVILFPDLVDFQGKSVEAIRVKARPKQRVETAPQRMQEQPAMADLDDEIPF